MKKFLTVVAVAVVLGLVTVVYAHGPARHGQGWRIQGETPTAQYSRRTTWARGHFGPMGAGPRGYAGHVGSWMMGGQSNAGPLGCPGFGTWAPTQETAAN